MLRAQTLTVLFIFKSASPSKTALRKELLWLPGRLILVRRKLTHSLSGKEVHVFTLDISLPSVHALSLLSSRSLRFQATLNN